MGRSFQTLSFLASSATEALAAREELVRIYGDVSPDESDVIVALGGDGLLTDRNDAPVANQHAAVRQGLRLLR